MARITHVIGQLVLVFIMTAMTVENPFTRAQKLDFSDEVTTDFTKGNIYVSKILTQDFLMLPMIGNCGLAAKFVVPHVIDTSTTKGTLRTTFEYLTTECTAEYSKEFDSCSTLNSAFGPCTSIGLDQRINHRPWGYCTDATFRVSYMWLSKSLTNTTTTTPMSSTMGASSNTTTTSLSSSSRNLLQGPACLAHGLGGASKNSTNPTALATLHKDIPYLNRVSAEGAMWRASAAATGANCVWRFSNLVPVAWDGIQNVLSKGQSLQSSDSRYIFTMQPDCNLVLYKKSTDGSTEFQGRWATFSQFNDPFQHECSTELQPNGNLVVRDPLGISRWESGATTSNLYSVALAVLSCGNVVVLDMTSGQTIWATRTGYS